jgi:hypothetical protein
MMLPMLPCYRKPQGMGLIEVGERGHGNIPGNTAHQTRLPPADRTRKRARNRGKPFFLDVPNIAPTSP